MNCNVEKCKTFFKKRFPFITWIGSYSRSDLYNDFIAGLTVSLLIIPQSLAYGLVAGLTPNHGLYSAFMGGFVYFLLGTTKEINIGPTAIMSLMTLPYALKGGINYSIFLCFACGVIQILAAVLNLGFLLNFISTPVISGFTSAAAITIASSQVKGLFGLRVLSGSFFISWKNIITNITDFRLPDFILGCSCIVFLYSLKNLSSSKCLSQSKNKFAKIIFIPAANFLNLGRNFLIVIITSIISYYTLDRGLFLITGNFGGGVPKFALPPFSSTRNNETISFTNMVPDIGMGLFTIPFISTLDHIAVVGAFTKGKSFDATQEMLAVGMVNLIGSFFGSMPTTTSLSRSAVNKTSGVKTAAGGIVTGIIVLLSLAFLTDYFGYIPTATLSAVIICAVLQMVNLQIFVVLWRTKRIELSSLSSTFVACLILGLEFGILVGIGVNIFILLYQVATPGISTSKEIFPDTEKEYVELKPSSGIIYPNASFICKNLQKVGIDNAEGKHPMIVNGSRLTALDFTAVKKLKSTAEIFSERKQLLAFTSLSSSMEEIFKKEKVFNVFENVHDIEEFIHQDVKQKDNSEDTLI